MHWLRNISRVFCKTSNQYLLPTGVRISDIKSKQREGNADAGEFHDVIFERYLRGFGGCAVCPKNVGCYGVKKDCIPCMHTQKRVSRGIQIS